MVNVFCVWDYMDGSGWRGERKEDDSGDPHDLYSNDTRGRHSHLRYLGKRAPPAERISHAPSIART